MSKYKTDKLFRMQKKCLRILYGNLKAYLEKFCTAARVRPYGEQELGSDFYQQEHTKPIFTNYKILTLQNLHKYMTINELMKIVKYSYPNPIYNEIKLSP